MLIQNLFEVLKKPYLQHNLTDEIFMNFQGEDIAKQPDRVLMTIKGENIKKLIEVCSSRTIFLCCLIYCETR